METETRSARFVSEAEPAKRDQPETNKARPMPTKPEDSAADARVEQLLVEIRDRLDLLTRDRRHVEFSVARLVASLVQALVIGLLLAAIADWLFSAPFSAAILKLAFAAVLQLAALTAFILARDSR